MSQPHRDRDPLVRAFLRGFSFQRVIVQAEAHARATGVNVLVTVQFTVGPEGIEAVEVPARFERRGVESTGGAT